MVAKEKVFDDIARVAGGTVSVLSDLGRNIREDLRSRADEAATRLNLVPREDFERLEAVLKNTRSLVDEQQRRIEALEQKLGQKLGQPKTTPSAKKTTKK